MKTRHIVLGVLGMLLASTAAFASTRDDGRVVQRVTDPATGLEVRVSVGGGATISIDVADPTVRIQKQLIDGRAVTTMVAGREVMKVTTDGHGITLDGTLGHLVSSSDRPASMDAARARLKTSAAVTRAIALLGRLDLGLRSPVGHTLLATRAMLLTEIGDSRGAAELARWADATRRMMALTRVALQTGPGDCWDEYTKEAIAAYKELEDCTRNTPWYDLIDGLSCGTIYDLRAIGAFSWWVHCVALRG